MEIVENLPQVSLINDLTNNYLWKTCGKRPYLFHKVIILN